MEDKKARADTCAVPLASQHLTSCLTRLYLPQDDCVLTADSSPENRAWLVAHLGKPVRITSRTELLVATRERHGAALLQNAVFGLAQRFPELSAQTVITQAQVVVVGFLVMAVFLALVWRPLQTVDFAMTSLSGLVIVCTIFRVVLALLAHRNKPPVPTSDIALPTYTILVPLYHEAAILPSLVTGLLALDYPGLLAQVPQVI